MEIEHILENHTRITERLSRVIDEVAQATPGGTTPILLAIIDAKVDVLRSLGIRLKAVAELEAKLFAAKNEIAKESAPKPDADGWIPHKAGKPMPINGNETVYVKINGKESEDVLTAKWWQGPLIDYWKGFNEGQTAITHYKLA